MGLFFKSFLTHLVKIYGFIGSVGVFYQPSPNPPMLLMVFLSFYSNSAHIGWLVDVNIKFNFESAYHRIPSG
jgi:hypothetical protein